MPKLTNEYLKSLQRPESGRLEVSDTVRKGLRFRLSAGGTATFMFEKRVKGGPKRKHTLGQWPEPVSLSTARDMALEIEAEASKGIDRIAIAEEERRQAKILKDSQLSVQEVIDIYSQLHLSTLSRGDERERQILRALENHLEKPMAELVRADIQQAVDEKAVEGYLFSSNRLRAALMAFTNWAWSRNYLTSNIAAGIPKATKEKSRDRVLTIPEIRDIWSASFQMGDVWGPVVRIMVLTAQRRGEILALRWDEVELSASRIVKPGSRTKNGKAHVTHLAPPALAELERLYSARGESKLVFTTTGTTPVSGIGKAKKRLDSFLPKGMEPWRLHDIRTGFATAMAESGESETVTDRILNHSASGSAPSAVARVYNRSELLPQRAAALNRWAEMVTQESATVVDFAGALSAERTAKGATGK